MKVFTCILQVLLRPFLFSYPIMTLHLNVLTNTLVTMVVLLFVCFVPQIQVFIQDKSPNPGFCLFRSLGRHSNASDFYGLPYNAVTCTRAASWYILYSSGTELLHFRRREPAWTVLLHLWHPDGHPLQEDKKWNRPSSQDRYTPGQPPPTSKLVLLHRETLIQRTLRGIQKMLHNSKTHTQLFFTHPKLPQSAVLSRSK